MTRVLRINLIPLREIRRARRRRLCRLAEATVILLTTLILMGLTWRGWTITAQLTSQLEHLGRVTAAGTSAMATAQQLRKRIATYGDKLSTLEEIRRHNTPHKDILTGLAAAIPNAVWLTRLEVANGACTIEGRAREHAMIAQFLRELEGLPQFTDNELVEVHQPKDRAEGANKHFTVRSRIPGRRVSGGMRAQKQQAKPR